MSIPFNSASRLFNIFSQIKTFPINNSYINVFAGIFELDKNSPHYDKEALDLAFLCIYELDALGKYAHETLKYPKSIFENHLATLKSAISIAHVNYNIEQFSHIITDTSLHNLEMFIYQIPDENLEDTVASINKSIIDLEELLAQKNYPEAWKAFIRSQITTLKAALRKHKINGVYALKEAETLMLGSIIKNLPLVRNFTKSETFITIMGIIALIDGIKNFADKTQEYLEYFDQLGITKAVEEAIIYYQQLPPP